MSEDHWQQSRLIPTSGIEGAVEQERRAASAFLAVLTAVREFNRALLKPFGAPAGSVETFCEVPFKSADGRSLRVDGVIRVTRGRKTWTVLVEVKTGSHEPAVEQVENYLDIVKQEGFDGLLTVTNRIAPVGGHHPIRVDGRKYRNVGFHHVSWTRVLSIAQLVMDHTGVSDPDQAWILHEFIRYLEHPKSGAVPFEDMGPHWVWVRRSIRDGTLRQSGSEVEDVVSRWEQLIQFICLSLSARLGSNVHPRLSRRELADPSIRTKELTQSLINDGVLHAEVSVPNAVGDLRIEASLPALTVTVSTKLAAPELKRPLTRLNWLLRQLREAPDDLRIDVAFARTRGTTRSDLLRLVRDEPGTVLLDNARPPREFGLALSTRVGVKRGAGKGGFITDVVSAVDGFYREVVQDLKPWTPPPPQLRDKNGAREPEDDDEDEPEGAWAVEGQRE